MAIRRTAPSLRDVEAELLGYEPIFHRDRFGETRADYLARTDEDYWEVGASGQIYERDYVVDAVVRRGKVEGDENWVVSDPCCRQVGEDTFALTYQLDQAGRLTRRVTIWRRERGRWKILYHQGTIIES